MVVHPHSHRIPRVRCYSGYCCLSCNFKYGTITLFGLPSQTILLSLKITYAVHTPKILLLSVWPLSLSLAATKKIDVSFSSSAYLDVSVQRVSLRIAMCSLYGDWVLPNRVAPFGNLRVNGYLLLTVAYRSLSRPSSAPDAKAFTLCSY